VQALENLVNEVSEKSKSVILLSKADWVSDKWDYGISWVLRRDSFHDQLLKKIGSNFEIVSTKLIDVYYNGEKRNDLAEHITTTVETGTVDRLESNGIITPVTQTYSVNVDYKSRGSSLELCQLQRTMMIILEVEYKNKAMIDKRYFNLTFSN
jgi:hypothetical protein